MLLLRGQDSHCTGINTRTDIVYYRAARTAPSNVNFSLPLARPPTGASPFCSCPALPVHSFLPAGTHAPRALHLEEGREGGKKEGVRTASVHATAFSIKRGARGRERETHCRLWQQCIQHPLQMPSGHHVRSQRLEKSRCPPLALVGQQERAKMNSDVHGGGPSD